MSPDHILKLVGSPQARLGWNTQIVINFAKISAKLYNLLLGMSPDHILKLVGWPQARLGWNTQIVINFGNLARFLLNCTT